ncbi:MAG: DUF2961 domain-containing protein [Candidatus Aminicenantes bacterium]|nr:DUF2961 domain-containing protein [Candidatus Aminicenantes bacterium]
MREPDETGVGEYLIADIEGPGAVVRLWTAAIDGRVKMYLDGSKTPLFEGKADVFFRHPYDMFPQIKSINRERFQETVYQRDASYAPIPFAEHLKVIWEGNIKKIHFYQMQVRLYPSETKVVSFTPEDISTYQKMIDKVTSVLLDPDTCLPHRQAQDMIASNEDVQDLPFLLVSGKGVYVGSSSYVLNPNPIPTSWGNWWGEGDEKVFVDDGDLPSLFGTGSEDYYNYSWLSPDIFFFPYCGQPRNDGPGNRGFVANFRWHILDAIVFVENLRFYMELFSHEKTPDLSYARIGYHNARPEITDDHLAIKPEDVRAQHLPEGWKPAPRFGARNSVFYPAVTIIKDKTNTRMEKGGMWAEGKLLVWEPRIAGERKNLIFTVDSSGDKRIYITAALTPRSGIISVFLDGKPLKLSDDSETINLNRPYRTLLRNFAFQEVKMDEGEHTLTLEYKDNTESFGYREIGLDFIWIQDIPERK